MPETGSHRVMQATWDWRSRQGPATDGPVNRYRRSAFIQAAVMSLIAGALYFGFHHQLFARIIWALAGLILVLGLFIPSAYRPVHNFGQWLGRLVGKILNLVLLVPFYFLFFTPVALLLRLQGRDPLHRTYRESQWTYWMARSSKDPEDNIDRQFLREDREARKELRPVGTLPGRERTGRS